MTNPNTVKYAHLAPEAVRKKMTDEANYHSLFPRIQTCILLDNKTDGEE